MPNYRLTRQANEDLVAIARYTQDTWGHAQRVKYLGELFALFDAIAQEPRLGTKVDFIREGLRKRLHAKRQHAAYYRIAQDGRPEILRVLHTKQNRLGAFE